MSALSTLSDIVTRVKTSDPDREALLEMLRDLNGEIRAEKKEALDTLDDMKADKNAMLELIDDYKNQLETASALEMALRRELDSKTKTIEELYREIEVAKKLHANETAQLKNENDMLKEQLLAYASEPDETETECNIDNVAFGSHSVRYINPAIIDVFCVMGWIDEADRNPVNTYAVCHYETGEIIAERKQGMNWIKY